MVSNQLRKKEIDSRETIVEMHHRIMGDEADVEIPNGIEAVKTAEVGTEGNFLYYDRLSILH